MKINQKLTITLLLGIIAGVIITNADIFEDQDQFKKLTASEKSEIIWKNIITSNGTHGREVKPSEGIRIMVPENLGGISLKDTFNNFIDLFSSEKEVKVAHTFGHMFKFKFQPSEIAEKKGLSGIFKGSEFGIGRFSSSNRMTSNKSRPSMGLKFLRDGQNSGDLLIQRKRAPQIGNHNPFTECMSNAIPNPDGPLEQANYASRAIIKNFKSHTPRTDFTGLSDLAKIDQAGNEIKKEKVNFPFALTFKPKKVLHEKCQTSLADYKEGDSHFPCLDSLEAGTHLYEVYAIENPTKHEELNNDKVFHIGDIISTSEFVKSKFGDNKLHFVHTTFENDIESIHDENRKELWLNTVNDEFMNQEICDKYLEFTQ